ncbi:MAG: hypothetical protein RIC35_01600 [Marinoscillum sp.]
MKNILFIILITFYANVSFGQDFSQLANVEFKTTESYKLAESQVLVCANYLFDNPTDKAELNRLNSTQYIIKWMSGTPDHTFSIDDKAMELTKGKSDLLGLYMAAMSKVVIENEGEKLTSDEIYNQSEKIVVDYCSNSDNKIKPSKKIKTLLKERKG